MNDFDECFSQRLVIPTFGKQMKCAFGIWITFCLFLAIMVGPLWWWSSASNDATVSLIFYAVLFFFGTPISLILLYTASTLQKYVFDKESRTVSFYIKLLGIIPLYRRRVSFDCFDVVRSQHSITYLTEPGWSIPTKEEWFQVVLGSKTGKDWVVGESRTWWTFRPCSVSEARQISALMGIPYQEINTNRSPFLR